MLHDGLAEQSLRPRFQCCQLLGTGRGFPPCYWCLSEFVSPSGPPDTSSTPGCCLCEDLMCPACPVVCGTARPRWRVDRHPRREGVPPDRSLVTGHAMSIDGGLVAQ